MRKIFLLVTILLLGGSAFAQEQKEKGYFFLSKLSYSLGMGAIDETIPGDISNNLYKRDVTLEAWDKTSISIINGYKFNKYFSLGIGVSYMVATPPNSVNRSTNDIYDYGTDIDAIPVFLYGKCNLTKTKVKPYIALSVGCVLPLNESLDENGGKYKMSGNFFEPELGVLFPIADKYAISLGLGYHTSWISYKVNDNFEYLTPSGALSLNVGFSF